MLPTKSTALILVGSVVGDMLSSRLWMNVSGWISYARTCSLAENWFLIYENGRIKCIIGTKVGALYRCYVVLKLVEL